MQVCNTKRMTGFEQDLARRRKQLALAETMRALQELS